MTTTTATPSVSLGPWQKGFQNIYDVSKTPAGALTEAENVEISFDGVVTPRMGFALVAPGVSSVFRHHDRYYGVYNNSLVEIHDTSATILYSPVIGKVNWTILNDEPVFTNNTILGRITSDGVKLIGVEEPSGFSGPPVRDGAPKYAVLFVSKDGEEGPMSELVGPGVLKMPIPTEPTVTKIRIFCTGSGDVPYEVTEIPVGTSTYNAVDDVSEAYKGRPGGESQFKARMPGGAYARYWRGRLLVARGRTLFISDPLRYGLYDQGAGRVSFPALINFIEPVEGGVFVALKGMGVYFLAGASPAEWVLKVADIVEAQANSSLLVPTALMKLDLQTRPEWVAVWLTDKGFAVGLPSGDILYPQADLLSGLPLGNGSLHFEGDRLIALSQ